jgi:hypothetical protein
MKKKLERDNPFLNQIKLNYNKQSWAFLLAKEAKRMNGSPLAWRWVPGAFS